MKKKTYSKEELEAKVSKMFNEYPKAPALYATTDGNVFLMENHARLHAGEGRVISFERPLKEEEVIDNPEEETITAKEAIKQIKTASLEDLSAFVNDDRKTVQRAYAERLEELGLQKDPKDTEKEVSTTAEDNSEKSKS